VRQLLTFSPLYGIVDAWCNHLVERYTMEGPEWSTAVAKLIPLPALVSSFLRQVESFEIDGLLKEIQPMSLNNNANTQQQRIAQVAPGQGVSRKARKRRTARQQGFQAPTLAVTRRVVPEYRAQLSIEQPTAEVDFDVNVTNFVNFKLDGYGALRVCSLDVSIILADPNSVGVVTMVVGSHVSTSSVAAPESLVISAPGAWKDPAGKLFRVSVSFSGLKDGAVPQFVLVIHACILGRLSPPDY